MLAFCAAGSQIWQSSVGAAVYAPLALLGHGAGRMVIVTSNSGTVTSVSVPRGEHAWSLSLGLGCRCNVAPAIWEDSRLMNGNDVAMDLLRSAELQPSVEKLTSVLIRLAFSCQAGHVHAVELGDRWPCKHSTQCIAAEGLYSAPVYVNSEQLVVGARDNCLHMYSLQMM